jgi:hypothetical protein
MAQLASSSLVCYGLEKHEAATDRMTADGAIGKIGETVGGPFSSKGAIGKQFTTEGSIGGTLQQLGKSDDNSSKR